MNPAKNIIRKCGGIAKTAEITGRATSVVHRWKYAKNKGGTGGSVPAAAQIKILQAAARGEVDVRPEDFFLQDYRDPSEANTEARS